MANKENLPPRLTTPPISKISPSNKPALGRQRDHSACRAADTPLKVKKTRENLKQQASPYAEIPPPCLHIPSTHHDHGLNVGPEYSSSHDYRQSSPLPLYPNVEASSEPPLLQEQQPLQSSLSVHSKIQRQKSVSRRMLSRVKQGIANKSKSSQSIRLTGSETSLARRLSARREYSSEVDRRSQSFELSRDSIESTIDEVSSASASTPPLAQRSFTDSTVSTSEILDNLAAEQIPSLSGSFTGAAIEPNLSTVPPSSPPVPSTLSPQPTPRPLKKLHGPDATGSPRKTSLAVPCVDLRVAVDSKTVDVGSKRNVWIAIDATVCLKTTRLKNQPVDDGAELQRTAADQHVGGTITNLRLCYKPAEGCRIRNVIGQKSYKDLIIGQNCKLFIKLGVPRMQTTTNDIEIDQESLFAELESIVGTLETDILNVEARYRHSLLPADNVVALKHTCKLLRPRTESRWSIIRLYEKDDSTASEVHVQLGRYLSDHYAADEALQLLHHYLDYEARSRPEMAEISAMLQGKIEEQRQGLDDQQPEVVVTDIDSNAKGVPDRVGEQNQTAIHTSLETARPSTNTASTAHKRLTSSSSLAPPLPTAPKTTTAITTSSPSDHESHDTAHRLWRHIRRTSLSARQLEEITPERLSSLEAGDDSLRELRRRALANKRSVGAETLRAWKWEEDVRGRVQRDGEAPWM